jgi:hypothetical protein
MGFILQEKYHNYDWIVVMGELFLIYLQVYTEPSVRESDSYLAG